MKTKLTNKILIPAVIIFMIILILAAFLLKNANSQNQIIEEIKLSDAEKMQIVDLGTNEVHIENEGVYMAKAKCPDKLCVHQGRISKAGQSIICLPNKIIVEIVGKKSDVDAVSGAR